MKRFLGSVSLVVAILVVAVSYACSSSKEETKGMLQLSISQNKVNSEATTLSLKVTAFSSWTLSIEGGDGWAHLDKISGSGNCDGITLTVSANEAIDTPRSCTIRLQCGGSQMNVEITQAGRPKGNGDNGLLRSDLYTGWMELPELDNPDRYFFTHDMTISSKKTRNFSFYFDPKARISVWVAYPLNRSLKGSGSRTDAWGLDPKVPAEYQANITSRSFPGNYDRGHQCPSADRLASGANEQTFYGTNMTPQLDRLNQDSWGSLEGYVRDWSYQFDTLYVVTGADIKEKYSTVTDNDGKAIAVPNGYFKALLGYKSDGSISGSVAGYTAIGFYFEHKNYTNNRTTIMANSMSISELEAKTGINFFANLPKKIGDEKASQIEKNKNSWWK